MNKAASPCLVYTLVKYLHAHSVHENTNAEYTRLLLSQGFQRAQFCNSRPEAARECEGLDVNQVTAKVADTFVSRGESRLRKSRSLPCCGEAAVLGCATEESEQMGLKYPAKPRAQADTGFGRTKSTRPDGGKGDCPQGAHAGS